MNNIQQIRMGKKKVEKKKGTAVSCVLQGLFCMSFIQKLK